MNKKRYPVLIIALLGSSALALPVQYRVATEFKNLNIATVESETDFENFTGRTNQVSGNLIFDQETKTGSGTLIVSGKDITTGVDLRDEDMRSKAWFNFDSLPEIKFQVTAVRSSGKDIFTVKGNLTLSGQTKPVTARVTLRYNPANATTKALGLKGDVVALTTKFTIKLSDFGITHPAIAVGRVNNTVNITLKAIATNNP
jgi:polyisoprenoid-binding protein YceI